MSELHLSNPDYLAQCDEDAAVAAEQYKDYVHQKHLFQELAKDMLASLKLAVMNEHEEYSDAKLEMLARASAEWKVFRSSQIELLREAGRREMKYETAKRRWETARSTLSLKREEIKRFPGHDIGM